MAQQVFVETVTERFVGVVLASTIRPATEAECAAAKERVKTEPCDHTLVVDEKGWLYDIRSCWVCGCGLGTV